MELNIALNSIVYIMIFLFPGIIFRKFLFIGKDSKQFDSGNLFERFIGTLFFSIISLVFCATIFFITENFFKIQLLDSISYNTVKDVLSQFAKNELPDQKIIEDNYQDFGILFLAIYLISMVSGLIFHFFNNKFRIINYRNYWNKLFVENDKFRDSDTLTYGYTQADVLIETNNGPKLYSGKIENYFINNNHELETIILSNVFRYKKTQENENAENISLKYIPGHHFIIQNNRILNVNLTYVYELKKENQSFKKLIIIVNLFFIFSLIGLCIFPFTNYANQYTPTIFRKILFIFLGLINSTFIFENIKLIVTRQWSKLNLDDLYFLLIFSTPMLWIFNLISGYLIFVIQIGITLLLAIFTKNNVSNQENSNSDSI